MTAAGIILGTAAYMSPEQAKGNPVTKTTDIWAFGCVLYEMLTGRIAFKGDGTADTMALIVRGEPDFGLLPSTMPPGIRTLLRHCLHKEQRRRWPDAGSLRIAIEDARAAPTDVATPAALTRPVNWRWVIAAAFAVVAAAALSALGVWRLARQDRPAQLRVCSSACRRRARSPARWHSPTHVHFVRPSRCHQTASRSSSSAQRPTAEVTHRGHQRRACPQRATRVRQLYLRRMDRLQGDADRGNGVGGKPVLLARWAVGRFLAGWPRGRPHCESGELKKVPLAGGPIVTHLSHGAPGGYQLGAERSNHLRKPRWRWPVAGGRRRRHSRSVDDT